MTGKKSDKATWAKEKTAFKQHSAYLYRSKTGTIFFFNIKTLSLVVPFLMFLLFIKQSRFQVAAHLFGDG